jgi:hypothetical protein
MEKEQENNVGFFVKIPRIYIKSFRVFKLGSLKFKLLRKRNEREKIDENMVLGKILELCITIIMGDSREYI